MIKLMKVIEYLDGVRIVRHGLFSMPRAVVTTRKTYLYQCDKCKTLVWTDGQEPQDCCTPCRICGKIIGDAKHERPTPAFGTLYASWPYVPQGACHKPEKRNFKKHWYAPEHRAKKR